MTEVGNCGTCLQPFHESAQQHTCKGCGDKIHSSILCPKCPKVVDQSRVVVLTGAPPVVTGGVCGATGAPGGIQGVSVSEAGGGTVPPAAHYDLITDLLDVNMFKVYVDMLKNYLPMMTVDTVGPWSP